MNYAHAHARGYASAAAADADAAALRERVRALEAEVQLLRSPDAGPDAEAYSSAQRASLRAECAAFLGSYRRHDRAANYRGVAPLRPTSMRYVREALWQLRELHHELLPEHREGGRCPHCRRELAAGADGGGGPAAGGGQVGGGGRPDLSDVQCVGDLEEDPGGAAGFSVGVAEVSGPAAGGPKTSTFTPPPQRNGYGVSFNVREADAAEPRAGPAGAGADAEAERASRRSAAFGSFTSEHPVGRELGGILAENRQSLRARRRAAKELAVRVNELKRGIDAARGRMDALKAAAAPEDARYSAELIAMRDLKGEYRDRCGAGARVRSPPRRPPRRF